MTVQLSIIRDPPNKVNKNVGSSTSASGTLREPCSIIDPVILMEARPVGYNYMYIPDFKRYYFITDVKAVNSKLVEVTGHVDVLKTYSADIRSFSAIVQRQENTYNTYLDDGVFKAYQNSKHKIITFPAGLDTFSYVLAIAGN